MDAVEAWMQKEIEFHSPFNLYLKIRHEKKGECLSILPF
jgi:hypothetical protein